MLLSERWQLRWLTRLVYTQQQFHWSKSNKVIIHAIMKKPHHVWILVRICDADVGEFNVEELINRMQRTTYAVQTRMVIHTTAHGI